MEEIFFDWTETNEKVQESIALEAIKKQEQEKINEHVYVVPYH